MNCMVFRTFAIVAVVVSLPLTTCSIRVHAASYRVLSTVSEGILNMRTGPGTGHPLVVAIPAGATGVQVGECRQPDDGGKKPWCSVSWRGYRGWVSSCCIVPEVTAHSPQSTPATSAIISYPVVFTRAADLRTLGVAVRSYGTDAKSTTRHQFGCYYYGDGGYDISISSEYLARFSSRGFSRRSLCMALVSEARFDPETGRRLPTYLIVHPSNLARNAGRPAPGDLTNELPLDVPDCFKSGLPYTDCQMNYDLKTGRRLTAEQSNAFKETGRRIEAKLRDPTTRRDFQYGEESSFTRGMIIVGFRHTGILNASFYDYSSEFPKGFGYALNADGAAAPDPSAETKTLSLDGKLHATQATLRALEAVLNK
jgi:uncharacterized protein YraI